MNTVSVLTLICGDYPAPPSLLEAMKKMPMKTVRERTWDGTMVDRIIPDSKTEMGQRYYSYLKEQELREVEAYTSGQEFKPSEFNIA